jgi:hypothetical protein
MSSENWKGRERGNLELYSDQNENERGKEKMDITTEVFK